MISAKTYNDEIKVTLRGDSFTLLHEFMAIEKDVKSAFREVLDCNVNKGFKEKNNNN